MSSPAVQDFFKRFLVFLGLWIVFDGGAPAGFVIGVPSAILAGWLSMRIAPPTNRAWSPSATLSLMGYFLWNSLVAGVDVAVRAFHPKLPLEPGFAACDCEIPAGPNRDLFMAVASLMPGSLPVGEVGDGKIILHCLDTRQPMAAQMTELQRRMKKAWGEETLHA